MKEYNGHRSWNAWNVSLWLANDEFYYNVVNGLFERHGLAYAIEWFSYHYEGEKTPDGAVFNRLCIKLAIEDLFA